MGKYGPPVPELIVKVCDVNGEDQFGPALILEANRDDGGIDAG